MPINVSKVPKPATIGIEGLASTYRAGAHIEAHVHAAHQIVHAVDGVMRVAADGGIWVVPPGRGLWMPAGARHEIWCISQVRMRTVYLSGDHRSFPRDVRVTGVSALMREIMVRIAEGAKLHQLGHLTAILIDEIAASGIEPLRLPVPGDERIARLLAHLRNEPSDTTSLDAWARHLAMSQRSLMRRIRDETGMPFRELRRQVRIIVSLERLALGQSVTNVALDVGFDSPSAFIQAFRSVTGSTPGRYMK